MHIRCAVCTLLPRKRTYRAYPLVPCDTLSFVKALFAQAGGGRRQKSSHGIVGAFSVRALRIYSELLTRLFSVFL